MGPQAHISARIDSALVGPLGAARGDRGACLALTPLAQALGWLVTTHHRRPVKSCATDDKGSQPLGLAVKDPDAGTAYLKDQLTRMDAGGNQTLHSGAAQDIAPYRHLAN